jgi:hypothetical protein
MTPWIEEHLDGGDRKQLAVMGSVLVSQFIPQAGANSRHTSDTYQTLMSRLEFMCVSFQKPLKVRNGIPTRLRLKDDDVV